MVSSLDRKIFSLLNIYNLKQRYNYELSIYCFFFSGRKKTLKFSEIQIRTLSEEEIQILWNESRKVLVTFKFSEIQILWNKSRKEF